jgi:hypothetical protein
MSFPRKRESTLLNGGRLCAGFPIGSFAAVGNDKKDTTGVNRP